VGDWPTTFILERISYAKDSFQAGNYPQAAFTGIFSKKVIFAHEPNVVN
jgi:hypothetical protein